MRYLLIITGLIFSFCTYGQSNNKKDEDLHWKRMLLESKKEEDYNRKTEWIAMVQQMTFLDYKEEVNRKSLKELLDYAYFRTDMKPMHFLRVDKDRETGYALVDDLATFLTNLQDAVLYAPANSGIERINSNSWVVVTRDDKTVVVYYPLKVVERKSTKVDNRSYAVYIVKEISDEEWLSSNNL